MKFFFHGTNCPQSSPDVCGVFVCQPIIYISEHNHCQFCVDKQTIVCRDVEIFLFSWTTTGAGVCISPQPISQYQAIPFFL